MPVEHVEESVAIRVEHQLARLPCHVGVDEDRGLCRIPVPEIVRRELVVPLQLAALCDRARGSQSEYRLSPLR